jgi:hypothetical protein
MANYINGYGNPRFTIRQSTNGSIIEVIDLDKLIYEGLIETYENEDIIHTTAKGIIHKIPRNVRIRFSINYSDYVLKDNLLKLQKILEFEKSGKAIFLTPRKDVLSRFYQVVYAGDSFDLALWAGGSRAPANKLPVLSWVTKGRVTPNWIDPDNILVPLDNFICI